MLEGVFVSVDENSITVIPDDHETYVQFVKGIKVRVRPLHATVHIIPQPGEKTKTVDPNKIVVPSM